MGDLLHDVKKKRIFIICITMMLLVFGCAITICLYSNEQEKQQIRKELNIQFKDDNVIEYGDKDFKVDSLIIKHTGNLENCPKLNTKKVGKVVLKFKVSKKNVSKQFQRLIEIKDTKPPEIVLNEAEIKVQQYDIIDFRNYVKSVIDPVDGKLNYSEVEIHKNGYYVDKGTFDTAIAGDYEIKVIAYDGNNNRTEKKIKVLVELKTEEISEQERISGTTPTMLTPPTEDPITNHGSGNVGEAIRPVQPTVPILCPGGRYPEKACNVSISHPSLIPSNGVYYKTWQEAWDAGMLLIDAGIINGYDVASVVFNDGTEKNIILFH